MPPADGSTGSIYFSNFEIQKLTSTECGKDLVIKAEVYPKTRVNWNFIFTGVFAYIRLLHLGIDLSVGIIDYISHIAYSEPKATFHEMIDRFTSIDLLLH